MTRKILSLFAALFTGCGGGGEGSTSMATTAPPVAAIESLYVNATASSAIQHIHTYINPFSTDPGTPPQMVERFAGGVAAGDYDNDGDIDLFVLRGDIGGNRLYQNDGGGVFSDVAGAAGVAFTKATGENYRHSGPSFVDIDGDRFLDLFVGGLQGDPSVVFRNNGDGTFQDVTSTAGLGALTGAETISSAFGDYDLDGDMDMFLAHWGTVRDFDNPGDTLHLWRNDSDQNGIRFSSVSVAASISPSVVVEPQNTTLPREYDTSFAPTFARIDDDPYPDVLLVADFNATQFFSNNGDGTFSNATDDNVLIDNNGMGSSIGDFDNDGDLDWFVSAIYVEDGSDGRVGNRLYRNNSGIFEDFTDSAGVADGGWGWGSCFADLNNDGLLDIYHTNGWIFSTSFVDDASRAFVQVAAPNFPVRFLEQAADLGIQDTDEGRGVVCADFDNDGDIDVFVSVREPDNAARYYRNDITNRNYLSIKLQGVAPNTEAVGARIWITVDGATQMREITVGSNFTSQNPTVQLFGLGNAVTIDELRVEWPRIEGGPIPNDTRLILVPSNQRMELQHPAIQ